ncbi:AraC family transcriptional regulator [uncultured Aquimarina sp.]|uniref:helix-turn-helix domain-containing protein n=1 Tax=uncultured Aquimarina sp. TaxID=575652 RepID=UPI00260DA7DA|nr:AraC family transcriptional regulator [uncultured Aquimarina sp.]
MKIYDFDIQNGIYRFEFEGLNTEIHSHPAVEIITAIEGTFDLNINQQTTTNLVFAIIDSNIKHKVSSQHCISKILMIESNNPTLTEFLRNLNITLLNGCFLKKEFSDKHILIKEIEIFAKENNLKEPTDKRIKQCLSIIENDEIEYVTLINSLTSKVFLSESRLSHLFKEQIGVSIKKYLVWNNLRKAIHQYLGENKNLTEISIENGFFDQAHLSNSFKNVLGVPPSKAYNSRTIQF